MNPHRRPSDDPSHDPRITRAPSPGDAGSSLRPVASASSINAPSFHAAEDTGTESFPFPPLTDLHSGPPQAWRNQSAYRSTSHASLDRPDLNRRSSRNPSIRIARRSNASLGGAASSRRTSVTESPLPTPNDELPGFNFDRGRARSASQPETAPARTDPSNLARHSRAVPQVAMPRLTEEGARPTMEELGVSESSAQRPVSPAFSLPTPMTASQPPHAGRMRRMSRFFWPGGGHANTAASLPPDEADAARRNAEYDDDMVDYLDTIDPEVQTLSTLTNIQNSLFIPDLGHWVNRRPTYTLSAADTASVRPRTAGADSRIIGTEQQLETEEAADADPMAPRMERTTTISSRLTESHYAALPHGTTLDGWSAADKEQLDDHVRHMLHSRRAKFKRRMKGFGQYVSRPLGFLVTLYATLITLFGLAWVLFLIGWVYVGDKQVYAIHIIDSVLVALFAIVGDGLIPFRIVDTYRMVHIWRYTRIMENAQKGKLPKQRSKIQKKGMPPDLRHSMDQWHSIDMSRVPIDAPQPVLTRASDEIAPNESLDGLTQGVSRQDFHSGTNPSPGDLEDAKTQGDDALWPLTPAQQRMLDVQQTKLAKSHSFYKPHETDTHYAFPIGYLIAVVILLDFHSCLQVSLGATTWGIDYKTRPIAITTVILCVSISCNIAAGLVITIGDRKTRKKEVHKLMDRQALTGDAMKKIEKERNKETENRNSRDAEKKGSARARDSEDLSSSQRTSREWGRNFKSTNKLTKDRSSTELRT